MLLVEEEQCQQVVLPETRIVSRCVPTIDFESMGDPQPAELLAILQPSQWTRAAKGFVGRMRLRWKFFAPAAVLLHLESIVDLLGVTLVSSL